MNPRVPAPAACVLTLLRFDGGAAGRPPQESWPAALDFADRTQLTLFLRDQLVRRGLWEEVPGPARQRLDQNLADNAERLRRLQGASEEIAARLRAAGLEFVTLKGLSHSPAFIEDPRLRMQYDLDLFLPPESVQRAREVLLDLGYAPVGSSDKLPTDHLPAMARRTGWRWRGNYFDPEIPPLVDLHFRFWDAATERLAAPGVEKFWDRRGGSELDLADRLGYAALHSLRHLLRGNLRSAHVYEIARFFARRVEDASFWARWRELHEPELQQLEAIVFRLAGCWFGAPAPAVWLPGDVELWLERFAWSPVEALFRPNKHELYLHLSLLGGWRDRWHVARRRLLPATLPGPVEAVYVPPEQMTAALRWRKRLKYTRHLTGRVVHHGRVLLPTLLGLLTWRRIGRRAPS